MKFRLLGETKLFKHVNLKEAMSHKLYFLKMKKEMNVAYSLRDLKTCLFKHWRETVPIIFTDFDRISEKKLFQDDRIEKILLKPLENFLINDYKTDIHNHEFSNSTQSHRVCKNLLKHNQFYFTCM